MAKGEVAGGGGGGGGMVYEYTTFTSFLLSIAVLDLIILCNI